MLQASYGNASPKLGKPIFSSNFHDIILLSSILYNVMIQYLLKIADSNKTLKVSSLMRFYANVFLTKTSSFIRGLNSNNMFFCTNVLEGVDDKVIFQKIGLNMNKVF